MLFGSRFPRLRLSMVGLALAAQAHLRIRLRRAILSPDTWDRFTSHCISLMGAGMVVFFAANAYLRRREVRTRRAGRAGMARLVGDG